MRVAIVTRVPHATSEHASRARGRLADLNFSVTGVCKLVGDAPSREGFRALPGPLALGKRKPGHKEPGAEAASWEGPVACHHGAARASIYHPFPARGRCHSSVSRGCCFHKANAIFD